MTIEIKTETCARASTLVDAVDEIVFAGGFPAGISARTTKGPIDAVADNNLIPGGFPLGGPGVDGLASTRISTPLFPGRPGGLGVHSGPCPNFIGGSGK